MAKSSTIMSVPSNQQTVILAFCSENGRLLYEDPKLKGPNFAMGCGTVTLIHGGLGPSYKCIGSIACY